MARCVVLDTNIFVAAGFNRHSASARIVEAVREGRLPMVWTEATRRETERIVRQIPPLNWEDVANLFRAEHCYTGQTHPEQFMAVPDPDDRKFAALAAATGATLVTQDAHLLEQRADSEAVILTASEFLRQQREEEQSD